MPDTVTLHTGTMLALYPDPATVEALTLPDGEPPEQLHLTVAYTGKTSTVGIEALCAAAETLVVRGPIEGVISGHARFTGGDDGDVIVALFDSPALERLRRDTLDALCAEGVEVPADHGYVGHITLAYIDPETPDPIMRVPPMPATFNALSVVYGTDRHDLPFEVVDGVTLLREAFARGWAASGGPMTDRVKAGFAAAVEMAAHQCNNPHVLEATLHLGHLEGVWALVYQRRDKLHAQNRRELLDLWRPIVGDLDIRTLVSQARREAGLTEADGLSANVIAQLGRYAVNLLKQVLRSARWHDLRAAVAKALARGGAEGVAGALALGADQLGHIGFNFDLAFDDAYAALENTPALLAQADQWLADAIGDQATALGKLLAKMTRDGASSADMQTAVAALLDEGAPVVQIIDSLTGRAMIQGALTLYAREGVDQASVITAGDDRVCPQCDEYEAESPFALVDVPVIPAHPVCRCSVIGSDPLPLAAVQPYLPSGEE